ncbi:MAG: oligosaccharide flippase family protein [Dermatophilus congolensis]|nr:oligosaccharide flippase family protein [Dermatophilus congolensis]
MNTLIQLAWATLERMFPRVASAVVMVAFAAFTAPDAVGVYSWVALTYTLYQALAENALRNQAVLAVAKPRHVASVRRSARTAAVFGSTLVALTLIWLWFRHGDTLGMHVLGLVPFVAAPFITTSGIVPMARMQYNNDWNLLARYMLIASLAGLSLSFATVVLTHSALAMAVHLLTQESTFLYLLRKRSRQIEITPHEKSRHPREGMASLVAISTLGWSQGQLERVFVGGLAGVATLGTYSTAVTMGRSAGEALSVATANYLRAQISAETDSARHPRLVRNVMTISAVSATLAVGAVLLLTALVLEPILGDVWRTTLEAVPFLAIATIPYSVSLALQVMAIYNDKHAASVIPSVLGLVCAPLIGWVALTSIHYAALVVIGKELMLLMVTYGMSRVKGAGLPVAFAGGATVVVLALMEVLR